MRVSPQRGGLRAQAEVRPRQVRLPLRPVPQPGQVQLRPRPQVQSCPGLGHIKKLFLLCQESVGLEPVRVRVPRHVFPGPGAGAGHVHLSAARRELAVRAGARVARHVAPRQDRHLRGPGGPDGAGAHYRGHPVLHRYKVTRHAKVDTNTLSCCRRPVQYRDLTDYSHSSLHSTVATPSRASYKITINQVR